MFKSAATKIAHNTTLPALALSGNKDLRPLQDLITAEKVVLITLQKLSVDFAKAGEALRIWGAGEGDDLGDVLGASTTVLAHFSAALSGYAAREHSIRDHLKAIRTREETLDELKRRRKATLARADSAEKKLSKMGPEHKNLAAQTDILNGLQAQIRQMDGDIMNEEASLGDFKRTSARDAMGLKFGGLMEVCEKGCVVAECGRVLTMEIPIDPTIPGLPRVMYGGHMRTQERVNEAERSVNEVVFQALPARGSMRDHGMGDNEMGMMSGERLTAVGLHNTGVGNRSFDASSMGGSSFLPQPDVGGGFMETGSAAGGYAPPSGPPPSSSYAAPGGTGGYTPPAGLPPGAGGYNPPGANGGYTSPGGYSGDGETRDDFGVGIGGTETGPVGGRFATFPVRNRGFSRSGDEASSGGAGQSASGSSPSPVYQQQSSQFSALETKQQERERERLQQQQEEEPAPEYRDVEPTPTTHAQVYDYSSAQGGVPPGPPPGAAPPVIGGVWTENYTNDSASINATNGGSNGLSVEEGGGDRMSKASEDIGLAYMSMGGEQQEEMEQQPETEREREARISRHVRFGPEETYSEPPTPASPEMVRQPSSSSLSPGGRRRVPPPTFDPLEEERALNAAAAREITREFEAMNASSPPLASPQPQQDQEEEEGNPWQAPAPQREFGSPPKTRSPPTQYSSPPVPSKESPKSPYSEPSPMIPPSAPFSRALPGPPSQDGGSPLPSPVSGHHTTPSWALRPASPAVDSPGSPSSPRLDAPYRATTANRSTTSLNTQPPAGARTISAAAFRRPQKTASGDVADTSPLAPKKRLPTSPYPQQRTVSGLRGEMSSPQQYQQPSASGGTIPPVHDDDFDYIGAYARDSQAFLDEGSPLQPDFDYGRLGKVQVVGGAPVSPGYAEGRFATDPNDVR
ncbi:hypothetical protein FB45DRAFT_140305 [Roridomyces roridus]|uniref:Eisosome component PIL1-domain-containing protein n=1 Tax=Roridomyces roridus TaxID=1738132 RepID=A0AAD7BI22_9AGAR|nr:hypothetical protein FB45DRAFT_140305 [Roridomyces roridus]